MKSQDFNNGYAQMEPDEYKKCPECGSENIIIDPKTSEYVCIDCGAVLGSRLELGPEWRVFSQSEADKRVRTGAPLTPLIHDRGVSTIISWRDTDAHGKKLEPKTKLSAHRLRIWQQRLRVSSAEDRNLSRALQLIEQLSSSLNLPKHVCELAATIYRKAVRMNLVKGRDVESMAAASVYIATRMKGMPIRLIEISKKTRPRLKRGEIGKAYRFLVYRLNLTIGSPQIKSYIKRFASSLNIPPETVKKAEEILEYAEKKRLTSGRGPSGIAASILYVAAILHNQNITQRHLSEASGVTEVTVRNRYKDIIENLSFIVYL